MTQRPMRVFVLEIAGRGGICHYTWNLLGHYGPAAEVTLYTGHPYELADTLPGFAVRPIFRRFATNPLAVLGMFGDALRRRPDVVHLQVSQFPTVMLGLALGFRTLGIPVVITAHNVVSHEYRLWQGLVFGALYSVARRVIVHSEDSARTIAARFRVAPERIRTIDHGNYMFFDSDRKPSFQTVAPFRVLFFGYIRPYKGLSVLLEALARLPADMPFYLEIVGRPVEPFRPYQELINRLGLSDRVETRLDYVPNDEVSEIFSRASVVVLPYLNIAQSGVLQLAYAFGKPVVVTATGGLPEVVEHGKSGFVIPRGDPVALEECLQALMLKPELAERMGRRARELAETRFSWTRIAPLNLEACQP